MISKVLQNAGQSSTVQDHKCTSGHLVSLTLVHLSPGVTLIIFDNQNTLLDGQSTRSDNRVTENSFSSVSKCIIWGCIVWSSFKMFKNLDFSICLV